MGAEEKARWWTTAPGMLTALAGVITAVTGLILGLHQIGVFDDSPPPAASTVAEAAEERASERDTAGVAAPEPSVPDGQAAGDAGPTSYETTLPAGRSLQSGDTRYEILGSQVRPDADGQIAVEVELRMTNDADYPDNFWDASFRLEVGEDVYAPTSGLNEIVQGRATGRGTVSFVIPEETREAELLVLIEEETVTVPFELRAVA
jgi:hypothetical protein